MARNGKTPNSRARPGRQGDDPTQGGFLVSADTVHILPINNNGETQPANGGASSAAGVAASGDPHIDGLLAGSSWSAPITYSDPDAPTDYQLGYFIDTDADGLSAQYDSFAGLTAQQMQAVHFALNDTLYTQPPGAAGFSIEGFTTLDITYAGAGAESGTIRLANTSDAATSYAFYPGNTIYGGDAWFGPSAHSGVRPTAGDYGWHTVLHEIGHALGLKHGQALGGPADVALPANVDSMEFSVMTYRSYIGQPVSAYTNETYGYAQTYMMLDIAALQYLYGADYTVNAGDTVYTWSPTAGDTFVNGSLAIDPGANRIFQTIWDGGGVDTYDLSNYTTALTIDLRPGNWSTFSSAQLADLNQFATGGFARGNVANALLFNGNLASLIENANGGSGHDTLYGNQADNVLAGGAGNDVIDGDAGNDTLRGGLGNDTYSVDSAFDVVIEQFNEGTDTIKSTLTYSLGNDIERLTLIGAAAINGTGNALGNILTGNSASNELYGLAGNDTLDGGAGADVLAGGVGNDIYTVDDALDVVSENVNEGTDTVNSAVTHSLANHVERLTLTGTSGINGTGNALNNVLTGNGAPNTLLGLGGNDTLNGGSGADTLIGGLGNDAYTVDNGLDVVVENLNEGTDTVNSALDYILGEHVENLTLTAGIAITGTGNAAHNVITGNSAANLLQGLDGNDTLNGGLGADTLIGGLGNDAYTVDNALDVVVENFNEGTDTVTSSITYALGADVENLTLTGSAALQGTGNAANNVITGNAAANQLFGLAGNDTLNGAAGADTLAGGLGDDIYTIDNVLDVVVENVDEGSDVVNAAVSYTLPAHVERLTLTGTAANSATGNSLDNIITGNSAANQLFGLDGNDTLNGGAGGDSMAGGLGDDVYVVDNALDAVTELFGQGLDTVHASIAYTLGAEVENLTLTGTAAINATGNALDNRLNGNIAANQLNGGLGADVLFGGGGNDVFWFSLGEANGDIVQDFFGNGAAAGDVLRFSGYGVGATFTYGSGDYWNISYGAGLSEAIQLVGVAALNVSDYAFV